METTVYTAGIRYGEAEIKKMDQALQASFFFSKRVCFLLICILLMLGGVALGIQTAVGMLCLLFGCFLFPNINSIPSGTARQVLRAIRGKTLPMRYEFRSSSFVCYAGDGKTEYAYHEVIRLVEEKHYLYLCLKPQQACMIDTDTLKPAELDSFKKYIADRVELKWTAPLSWTTFSIRKLQFNRENTRGGRGR